MSVDIDYFIEEKLKYNKITLTLGILLLLVSIPMSLFFYQHFSKKAKTEYDKMKSFYLENNRSREDMFVLKERVANLETAFKDSIQYIIFILTLYIGTIIFVVSAFLFLLYQQGREYIRHIQLKKN